MEEVTAQLLRGSLDDDWLAAGRMERGALAALAPFTAQSRRRRSPACRDPRRP